MSANTQANMANDPGVTKNERSQLNTGQIEKISIGGSGALLAIAQRELTSLFYSPIAYVVGFVFLLLTGWFFVSETIVPGNEASLRTLFERMAGILVIAIPLLTMRSVADEFHTNTIETLMTAPVKDHSVILGKFLGTMLFYILLLATTLFHFVLMKLHAAPITSVVVMGYLGMILIGALFIAIGIFASCCTKHQLLAAIISVVILALFTFVANYCAEYANLAWQRQVCSYVNIMDRFSDFSKGIMDTGSLIFFITGTVFFLFLANKILESQRWR